MKCLKYLKWYNKALINNAIGLTFEDGKTGIVIQPNVIIKPQRTRFKCCMVS